MTTKHFKFRIKEKPESLPKKYRGLSSVYDSVSTVAAAFTAVFLILVFIFRIASVNGSSMEPTLHNGDWLVLTDYTENFKFGDIVVISPEGDEKYTLIKRVIGVGGDVIDIDFENGIVYRNGEKLEEDYIKEPTRRSFSDGPTFPLTVPDGYLFVMGDNRNDSLDSRSGSIGLINTNRIIGKMVFRIYENG